MVLWHIPAVYDWASWHDWAMNWLMAPMFVATGYLFWRVILPSHPGPPGARTGMQVAAIVITAFEMLVLAMAMAIFTKTPWYSMNVLMDGPVAALATSGGRPASCGCAATSGPSRPWCCGLPHLRVEGGVSASLEQALGRA